MTPVAKVVHLTTLDNAHMHTVNIYDPTAQALADLFLPPDGTQISGEDLEAAVERLVEATNAIKRLEAES